MPRCGPAGARPPPLPFGGRPPWPRPCSGRPRRHGAGAHRGTETAPATGGAGQRVLCWLAPAGRWAPGPPLRQCPADVACAGCGLPSRPSPGRGRSPPLRTLRAQPPHPLPAGLPCRRPAPLACPLGPRGASVPAWFRVRVAPAVPHELSPIVQDFPRPGASAASQGRRRLSACLPRPEDAGGPAPPRPNGGARGACGGVHTLGGRTKRLCEAVPALPGARSPLRPTGGSGSASPILVARLVALTPPWTQDAIRVGGSPFPDQDFPLARDAKLFLAR